jgi:hypothetical protein
MAPTTETVHLAHSMFYAQRTAAGGDMPSLSLLCLAGLMRRTCKWRDAGSRMHRHSMYVL